MSFTSIYCCSIAPLGALCNSYIQRCFDDKAYTYFAFLPIMFGLAENRITWTHFCQLLFVRTTCLREGNNINIVFFELECNQSGASLWAIWRIDADMLKLIC